MGQEGWGWGQEGKWKEKKKFFLQIPGILPILPKCFASRREVGEGEYAECSSACMEERRAPFSAHHPGMPQKCSLPVGLVSERFACKMCM